MLRFVRSHPFLSLLLIAVIIAVVVGVLLFERVPPRDMTVTTMAVIETRARTYWQTNKRAPAQLSDLPLLPGRRNDTTDGWGRPIQYELQQPSLVTLRSLGSDGQPGGQGDAADLVFQFDLAKPQGI